MKMLLPPMKLRQEIDDMVRDYFTDPGSVKLKEIIQKICWFYQLPVPSVEAVKYIKGAGNGRRTLGIIYEYEKGKSGKFIYEIKLIQPEHWKHSEDVWVETLYHEMGHYVLWADAETKADLFARKFQEGLK